MNNSTILTSPGEGLLSEKKLISEQLAVETLYSLSICTDAIDRLYDTNNIKDAEMIVRMCAVEDVKIGGGNQTLESVIYLLEQDFKKGSHLSEEEMIKSMQQKGFKPDPGSPGLSRKERRALRFGRKN